VQLTTCRAEWIERGLIPVLIIIAAFI